MAAEADIPLVILESLSVISPIVEFITSVEARHPGVCQQQSSQLLCNWWESILHNQTNFFLRALR